MRRRGSTMHRIPITLFCYISVVVSNPDPNPNPHLQMSWPWLPKPGQSVTPAYYGSQMPSWSYNGGGSGHDNRGWGPQRVNGWGEQESNEFESGRGETSWGSKVCGGAIRRPRCAPSINEIEQRLLGAAKKMAGFCTAYSDRPLREVYGVEHFKLRVRLSEFTEDDIQVRVRQRLVTILARTCNAEYAAVRILPEVVDSRHGMWKVDGHRLTVMFPYTITPDTEIQSRCGREYDPDPIIVPKSAAGVVFAKDFDVTFSDAKLRRAIKRALEELVEDDGDAEYVD